MNFQFVIEYIFLPIAILLGISAIAYVISYAVIAILEERKNKL